MRLAKLTEFRALFYTPDSAPSLTTLRAGIESIPGGCRQGKRYYVDLDAFERANNLTARLTERRAELTVELEGLL